MSSSAVRPKLARKLQAVLLAFRCVFSMARPRSLNWTSTIYVCHRKRVLPVTGNSEVPGGECGPWIQIVQLELAIFKPQGSLRIERGSASFKSTRCEDSSLQSCYSVRQYQRSRTDRIPFFRGGTLGQRRSASWGLCHHLSGREKRRSNPRGYRIRPRFRIVPCVGNRSSRIR